MPTPRWLRNLIDLVPPVKESRRFRYFDFWRRHPFQPDDRQFRLTNAGWLAEAAMRAYSPPEQALEIFERFGPSRTAIEFVGNAERDTKCYLLINDAFVVGVFRGSEVLRPDRRTRPGSTPSVRRGWATDPLRRRSACLRIES